MWELYKRRPGIVLGFHGCDTEIGEAVLSGKKSLKISANEYDWLGNGIYFWEGDPSRAQKFSQQATKEEQKVSKGQVKEPFVLGAIIDLGYCCNLVDSDALSELRDAHAYLKQITESSDKQLPVNRGDDQDLKARLLDCAVIETMHAIRFIDDLPAYDTVRSPFWEGKELYPGAFFTEEAHIQIAVRDAKQILGYFRPISSK